MKQKITKLFIMLSMVFSSLFLLVENASAHRYHHDRYYRDGVYVNVGGGGKHYWKQHHRNCYWVGGHWYRGHWYPAHKACYKYR